MQHGGTRYYLNEATYSENVIFQSRNVGPSHQLTGASKVYLGGDRFYNSCLCHLQYVRMYWNYVADSQDKMINFAMMNADGIYISIEN